jgi:acetyl-CoA carboxylase beta subunit
MEFDFEQEHLLDTRKTIFISSAVKAKRCELCSNIYFVNDMHNEFNLCLKCRGVKNRIETHATSEDRVKYED